MSFVFLYNFIIPKDICIFIFVHVWVSVQDFIYGYTWVKIICALKPDTVAVVVDISDVLYIFLEILFFCDIFFASEPRILCQSLTFMFAIEELGALH